MNRLHEKIYIDSSMVYEFLASIFRLECHEKLLPTDTQKLKYVPEDLLKWVEKSRPKLTESMKRDMNVFFNYESFLGLSLIRLCYEKHCYDDINDFFKLIEDYPSKELVKDFFRTGYGPEEMLASIDDPLKVKKFLDKSSLPEVEKWKLMYFCSSAEETKERFLALLKDFYIRIFKNNIEALKEIHIKSINYMTARLSKKPYELLQKLIDFDLESSKLPIVIIPSYYYNTASFISYYGEEESLIYIYGTAKPEFQLSEELSEQLSKEKILTAIKVLSDENRIKTIEILNTTPCYGYEISQRLGISSSTMSHHLSLLTDIGAITSVREENKVYYKVNKDYIKKLLKQFEKLLT